MTVPNLLTHSRRLWAARKAKCLATIEQALRLLREIDNLPDAETELNRLLYFCLLRASRELYPQDEIAPVSECNNQPDPDDETRAWREWKRPDFQWIYLDRYASDPVRSSRQFVVECKRLGAAPRAAWVLNSNYIHHGVRRFNDPEWAYAQGTESGAMVGYWQSMEGTEILNEVNEMCRMRELPEIVLLEEWAIGDINRLEHTLERQFAISPFKLHHIWIDLRVRAGVAN
jgi:hypothetical protein